MAKDFFSRHGESTERVPYRGLRDGLFALTVLLAYIPLLLHYFYPPAARTLLSDAGYIVEVLLILVWGLTGSVWIVDTKRKRDEQACAYEEKLQELRRTFEDLITYHPHGILIFDRDGNLLQANPAAHRLLGQEFEPSYNVLRDPAWQEEGRAVAIRDALAGNIAASEPSRRRVGETGAEIVLRTTLFPLFDDQKAVTHLVILHEDISEQESLEEQLLHAQKMESVGTLAGGVAHDFNNILQAILGNVSLIKLRLQDSSAVKRYAEEIEQSARRAANLTSQLLAFVRGSADQMQVIDLNHCVESALKLLQASLDKNIEVRTRLASGLWSIQGNATQIEQALMNLCINARDAMPQGGVLTIATENISAQGANAASITVRRLIKQKGRLVALTVRDTGVGMDATTRRRVFEPFYTTKPLGKGTGLGASMVYAIVQKYNGHVEVTSALGHGTIFWLYFPASTQTVVPPAKPVKPHPKSGHEQILLVDDEESVLAAAEEGLRHLGYRVLIARDGVEAVLVFQEHHKNIDVVVLDMIMPNADGLTALRDILKIRPDARVILISGYSESDTIQTALSEGAKRLIQKPFTPDDLAGGIREVLDGRRLDKVARPA